MKKFRVISIFLVLAMLLGAVSCGSGGKESTSQGGNTDTTYTVTFDTAGGEDIPAQTLKAGDKVEEPMDPLNGDKEFVDWYKEATFENVWDFENDTISGDTVIYAKFNSTFTVLYYNNATENASIFTTQKVSEGGKAVNLAYLSAGIQVTAWYTDKGLTKLYEFDTPVTENLSLYPVATEKIKWVFPADRNVGGSWGILADSGSALGSVEDVADGMKVSLDPGSWTNYLKSPNLGVVLNENRTSVKIVYKNLGSVNNLKIFFTTISGQTTTEWKGANFPVLQTNMSEDGAFAEVTINMKQAFGDNWKNSLWNLRFEVKSAESNPPETGTIIIQSIELVG